MRSHLLLFCFLLVTISQCNAVRAASGGFSEYPLRIDGKIIDHMIRDVNGDGKNDVIALFLSREKYFAGIFIQNINGFSYDPNQQFQLPEGTIGIDVSSLSGSGSRELCALTESGLIIFPYTIGRFAIEKSRSIIQSSFEGLDASYHPSIMPMYYKNKLNGKNSFIILRDRNFVIFQQDKNGKFVETGEMNASPRVPLFGPMLIETIRGQRTLDGIHFADLNNDSRIDICSINTKGCSYFFQNEDGSFPETPTAALPLSENQNTRLLGIVDCNGDGTPDLVFLNESLTNFLSNKRTTIGVYVGARSDEDKIVYKTQADHQWMFTGVQIVPTLVDYNSDGIADLVVTKATYNLGNIISSLIGGKSKLQVEFYRGSRSEFATTPEAIRETVLPGKIYDDFELTPIVGFGDVTGDGKRDFILGEESAIFIYPGIVNRLFESTATSEISYNPAASGDTYFYKIDNDQREDLCLIERKKNPSIIHIYLAR